MISQWIRHNDQEENIQSTDANYTKEKTSTNEVTGQNEGNESITKEILNADQGNAENS